mmetsp:Transcript_4385/g.11364  ORF Transcript_4385/g.11364 Transcript_4385/m.11364 type:complete len:322 (+) Transcript_4385:412-1377(+)
MRHSIYWVPLAPANILANVEAPAVSGYGAASANAITLPTVHESFDGIAAAHAKSLVVVPHRAHRELLAAVLVHVSGSSVGIWILSDFGSKEIIHEAIHVDEFLIPLVGVSERVSFQGRLEPIEGVFEICQLAVKLRLFPLRVNKNHRKLTLRIETLFDGKHDVAVVDVVVVMLEHVSTRDVSIFLTRRCTHGVLANVHPLLPPFDFLLQKEDTVVVKHRQRSAIILHEHFSELGPTCVVAHRPADVVSQEVSQTNRTVSLGTIQNEIFILGEAKEREVHVVGRAVPQLDRHSLLFVVSCRRRASDFNARPAIVVNDVRIAA